MHQAIDHNELDESLQRCGSNWNASQVHGLLCSRVSIAGADGASLWLSQVLADTNPDDEERNACEVMLDSLFSATWRQLNDEQKQEAGSDPVPLFQQHPTLIKRPVITDGERVLAVGFSPEKLEEFI